MFTSKQYEVFRRITRTYESRASIWSATRVRSSPLPAMEAALLVNQMHTHCGELLVSVDMFRKQEQGEQQPTVETPAPDPLESDGESEPDS